MKQCPIELYSLTAARNMKYWFITAILCVFTGNGIAQSKYADSLKAALVNTTEPFEQFNLMNKMLEDGYINGRSNPDSSYCIRLLDIAQELDSDSLLAVAYNQLGNYFFRDRNDLSRALEYFFKAIPFAEAVNDKRRISSLYIDIAALYYKLNNAPEEIKYIRKAFANLPGKESPLYYFMLAQAQYESGRYFVAQQQTDSALYYAQALGVTNLSLKSPLFEAATNGLMGVVYDKMGDPVLAEAHILRANSINDSMQYVYGKIEGKRVYIDYLLRNGKIPEAKKQALLLMDVGEQKNIHDVKRIAAGYLTTVYDKDRQPDSAFYFSRMESAMKDSVFNQDNLNKIQALAFDERIRIMEEDDRLADEAEKRRQNLQYVLLALGIVIFIMLYLLLSRSFITNTKIIEFFGIVALLIVFEFLNLLLHPFLAKLTDHSPVLMLLALVCIAALLVPMHHKVEKWATGKLVEKNKKIRLAAAKKTIEQLGGNELL